MRTLGFGCWDHSSEVVDACFVCAATTQCLQGLQSSDLDSHTASFGEDRGDGGEKFILDRREVKDGQNNGERTKCGID